MVFILVCFSFHLVAVEQPKRSEPCVYMCQPPFYIIVPVKMPVEEKWVFLELCIGQSLYRKHFSTEEQNDDDDNLMQS